MGSQQHSFPVLEAVYDGSWCPVRILDSRSDRYLVHYKHDNDDEKDTWLPITEIRLAAREADDWDCRHILKRRVDVSVCHDLHPHSVYSGSRTQSGWYDAMITRIDRKPHRQDSDCKCKFSVQFYEWDKLSDLSGKQPCLPPLGNIQKVVEIGSINILQRPVNGICFSEILQAHLGPRSSLPLPQWSYDAIFLKETRLAFRRPHANSRGNGRAFFAEKIEIEGEQEQINRGQHDFCMGGAYKSPDLCTHGDGGKTKHSPPFMKNFERVANPEPRWGQSTAGARMDSRDCRISPEFVDGPELGSNVEESSPKNSAHGIRAGSKRHASEVFESNSQCRQNSNVGDRNKKRELNEVGVKRPRTCFSGSTDNTDDGMHENPEVSQDSLSSLELARKQSKMLKTNVLQPGKNVPSSLRDKDVSRPGRRRGWKDRKSEQGKVLLKKGSMQKANIDSRNSTKGDNERLAEGSKKPGRGRPKKVKPNLPNPAQKPLSEPGTPEKPVKTGDEIEATSLKQKKDMPSNTSAAQQNQLRKLRPRPSGRSLPAVVKPQKPLPSPANLRNVGKGCDKIFDQKMNSGKPVYVNLLETVEKIYDEEVEPNKGVQWAPALEMGLKESWNSDLYASDSDCQIRKDEDEDNDDDDDDPVWRELDEALAKSDGLNQNRMQEKDQEGKQLCEHDFHFDGELGMTCKVCGEVGIHIANMVPILDNGPRRHYEEGVIDDWDVVREEHSPSLLEESENLERFRCGKAMSMLPNFGQQMHAHQKEGFEFLWKNLGGVSGTKDCKKPEEAGGCILSHAPGTGKSFLIISFLKSYMMMNPKCKPLIVAPKIMLRPWEKEFRKWKSEIPVYILNTAREAGKRLLLEHGESGIVNIKHTHMSKNKILDNCRLAMLYEWHKRESVCILSYSLFSSLTHEGSILASPERAKIGRTLLNSPDLLILDEGHFPRNKGTKIRKSLIKVRTKLRILLSGTLFQNNFEELFNTLYLVRPGFVESFSKGWGTEVEGSFQKLLDGELDESVCHKTMEEITRAAEARYRRFFMDNVGSKIAIGQRNGDESKVGLERLQSLTSKFIHHHTGEVLKKLPGLRDFALLLKPTPEQRRLLAIIEGHWEGKKHLEREFEISSVCIHPKLLKSFSLIQQCTQSSNEIESSLAKDLKEDAKNLLEHARQPVNLSSRVFMSESQGAEISPEQLDAAEGVKTKFVLDFIKQFQSRKDKEKEKILIFSQNLSPLAVLAEMFVKNLNWIMSKDFLRLDGRLSMDERQSIIEKFNDNPVQVLLASTKACGEGITLTGASRVIFLDVLWNPAVIRQAVSRAFRLGQKQTVYVYRLIASETYEENKYKKAVWKDELSRSIFLRDSAAVIYKAGDKDRVKGCRDTRTCYVTAESCEDEILEKLLQNDKEVKAFAKVIEHGSEFAKRQQPAGEEVDFTVGTFKDREVNTEECLDQQFEDKSPGDPGSSSETEDEF